MLRSFIREYIPATVSSSQSFGWFGDEADTKSASTDIISVSQKLIRVPTSGMSNWALQQPAMEVLELLALVRRSGYQYGHGDCRLIHFDDKTFAGFCMWPCKLQWPQP